MRADLQSTKVALYNIILGVCAVYVERCVNVSVRAVQGLLGLYWSSALGIRGSEVKPSLLIKAFPTKI